MHKNINNQYFKYNFFDATTALFYGIKQLDIKPNTNILVPETICDEMLKAFIENKINIEFYELNDDFKPEWKSINNKINKKTSALLMVHYFGFPQEIDKYIKFAKNNNIYLIEDNAHGYSGEFKGNILNTIGDIAITSPRKLFKIYSGGCLYSKNRFSDYSLIKKARSKIVIKRIIKHYSAYVPFINKKIIHINNLEKIVKKELIEKSKIDSISLNILKRISIDEESKKRETNFLHWKNFCDTNSIKAIFNNFYAGLTPWAFPAYASDLNERDKLLEWSKKNNVGAFTWPNLPSYILENHPNSKKRWQRLICFPLNN